MVLVGTRRKSLSNAIKCSVWVQIRVLSVEMTSKTSLTALKMLLLRQRGWCGRWCADEWMDGGWTADCGARGLPSTQERASLSKQKGKSQKGLPKMNLNIQFFTEADQN